MSLAGGWTEFGAVVIVNFLAEVFFWRGGSDGAFARVFLRILWCSVVVNRGEVVVD